MALETVVNIADLVRTNPTGTDPKSQGDDHLRNLKTALLNDLNGFTGAIMCTGVDGGAVNAYTLTPTAALIAYGLRMLVVFAPTATNTGATTLNISGLGVKNVLSVSGAALVANDLVIGNIYSAFYNGTEFRLLSLTKNYVDQLAFSAVLPAQPGDALRRWLKTLGGAASWAFPDMFRSARVANAILVGADSGSLIDITANSFTQTFTAAATLSNGWYCIIRNSGTGQIALDPNGAELIDGLAGYTMYPNESRLITCDGAAFFTTVLSPFYLKVTVSQTFTMPPGYAEIELDAVGGGGQGGSGRRGAVGSIRAGGAPGGTPSRVIRKLRNIVAGTGTTITIGAGGTTGAAAQTVDDTDGINGQAGGNTTFGALLTAFGGAAGQGGGIDRVATSGSGLSVGVSTKTAVACPGGLPKIDGIRGSAAAGSVGWDNWGEGGGGVLASSNAPGGNTEYGGAASAMADPTLLATIAAGSSLYGVSAATCGGWITSANTLPATAPRAGLNGTYSAGAGAIGGTCGAAPTAGTAGADAPTDDKVGNPGAGGGSTITAATNAQAGGQGGLPGGPGGGGGAVLNGQNSGPGGPGRNGQCIVKGIV